MILFYFTTDQVRLALLCANFCMSYALPELRILELVFRTFLLHPLTYRVDILYMILFYFTTDQVRLALLCANFCMSYVLPELRILEIRSFPHFSPTSFDI